MAQKLRTPSTFPEGQSLFPSTYVRQFSTVCNFRRSDTHSGLCRHPNIHSHRNRHHISRQEIFFLTITFTLSNKFTCTIIFYFVVFFCLLLLISSLSAVWTNYLSSIDILYKYCNRINTTDLCLFSVMFKIL